MSDVPAAGFECQQHETGMYLNVGFLFPVELSMAELWIYVVIKSFGLGGELSTLDMNEGVLLTTHRAEKEI